MSIKKTIGGDRLGSGKKMKVDLKTYNRSTFDLSTIWRSTMSPGTLVPFLNVPMLPGDTFDIDLDAFVNTHPTVGPLFGSFKLQLDVFKVPIRLYLSELHNNRYKVGMEMNKILLPRLQLRRIQNTDFATIPPSQLDTFSINPSSLLAYLGQRGTGASTAGQPNTFMQATGLLAYWDIYKNYYANHQEGVGAVIDISPTVVNPNSVYIDETPLTLGSTIPATLTENSSGTIYYTTDVTDPNQTEYVELDVTTGGTGGTTIWTTLDDMFLTKNVTGAMVSYSGLKPQLIGRTVTKYRMESANIVNPETGPQVNTFPLGNIDNMRDKLLQKQPFVNFTISPSDTTQYPYNACTIGMANSTYANWRSRKTQQGLAIKTYQNDMYNNYMNSEWLDNSSTGINAITAIDTSGGSFTLDQLRLANKVNKMLNRIAISGGSYRDWLETVYTHEWVNATESPVYEGGLSQEIVFEEVISNSAAAVEELQPLGTLGGKGKLGQNRKGGKLVVKADEISVLMGIVSITPRIDYYQGNEWFNSLLTIDDYHKPELDGIGFQDLLQREQAWWAEYQSGSVHSTPRTGKQPAWINYMTNVNKVFGNFAEPDNEMFMVLTRRYEKVEGTTDVNFAIKDNTTYIDPAKFNHIFADTSISAQNFWVQIGVDLKARRKMSSKVMPNL